ncbi:MAG: ATP-dependent metallopeptidase FtsH/Yme1/Tma family protein, partial [Bacteroidaceae bacterium]|nr:ATP-dependent metallopeptidase FtsH/Yme1/Tma family protein [Bacteroidaceae bacterium]MCF0187851.1 ATP-dependent metallopeptidase FtsH/Yme1/Tma family protein [Bacteroidaceae bacterium]
MEEKNKKPSGTRFNLNWLYLGLIICLGVLFFTSQEDSSSKNATYSEFKTYVEQGYASKIVVNGNKDGGSLRMYVTAAHIRDVFKADAQTVGT